MNKLSRLLTIALVVVSAMILPIVVFSATSAQGLTVSPPLTELTISPGQTVTQTIHLSNPTSQLLEVYPKVMNFKSGGLSGEPSFYEESTDSGKYSLTKWITFNDAKIALAPQQIVEYKYQITLPTDAEPGGHYGAVFFANQPDVTPGQTSQVGLGSMIGSLVLVKVPGDIIESGAITSFLSSNKLYHDNKVSLQTLITNNGNIHFAPKGDITITGMGGGKVDSLKFNESSGNVLPDSSREYDTSWNSSKLLVGSYTAKVNLVYGDSGKTMAAQLSFWIIPLWVMILAGVLLVLLIILVIWLFIRRRKKKIRKSPPQAVRTYRQPDRLPGEDGTSGHPPIVLR